MISKDPSRSAVRLWVAVHVRSYTATAPVKPTSRGDHTSAIALRIRLTLHPLAAESSAMVYFLADDHYQARPGAALFEVLNDRYHIVFHENDVRCIAAPEFAQCELLILNLIAGTGGVPLAGSEIEQPLHAYIKAGKPLLLLHGASAAFWHWDWWRGIVGYRWVRGEDPDNVSPSTHPTRPYKVKVTKCRHPLCTKLRTMDFPADEIYINLEQTAPTMTLLETTTDEGTFPQCYETITPWGGRIIGFLPGHRREVVTHPDAVANVATLIEYLLRTPRR